MENINAKMLEAANKGDLVTVEKLVRQGADINFVDQWGNFAMFSAAWEGNVRALDQFFHLGAKLRFDDANLLCNAAYNGKVDSVKWLLKNGDDAKFTFSTTGENALHYTLSKTTEINERTEIMMLLLGANADVHQKTIPGRPTLCFMREARLKGETPLHRAAAYAPPKIIKMLLDAGANPSIKDANGDTPISWASWHLRDSEVLKLLVYDGVAPVS